MVVVGIAMLAALGCVFAHAVYRLREDALFLAVMVAGLTSVGVGQQYGPTAGALTAAWFAVAITVAACLAFEELRDQVRSYRLHAWRDHWRD